jgi:hypothetical protein
MQNGYEYSFRNSLNKTAMVEQHLERPISEINITHRHGLPLFAQP